MSFPRIRLRTFFMEATTAFVPLEAIPKNIPILTGGSFVPAASRMRCQSHDVGSLTSATR